MKTESNLYFAKATKPSLDWKTPWLTMDEARIKAEQYVRDWRDSGATHEASVFYRDGSMVHHVTIDNLPEDVPHYDEHGDRN